jgi:hypothetical protein
MELGQALSPVPGPLGKFAYPLPELDALPLKCRRELFDLSGTVVELITVLVGEDAFREFEGFYRVIVFIDDGHATAGGWLNSPVHVRDPFQL